MNKIKNYLSEYVEELKLKAKKNAGDALFELNGIQDQLDYYAECQREIVLELENILKRGSND